MEKLEKEFAALKERWFAERMEALDKESEGIENGTHQLFLRKLEELEEARQYKVMAAQKARDFQIRNVENVFDAEKQQAENELDAEKLLLKERMKRDIEEKIKRLTEERNNLTLTSPKSDASINKQTSKQKRKENDSNVSETVANGKKVKPSPPVAYTLKESEILDDIKLIQKAVDNNPYTKAIKNAAYRD